jgi:hypothetical protein
LKNNKNSSKASQWNIFPSSASESLEIKTEWKPSTKLHFIGNKQNIRPSTYSSFTLKEKDQQLHNLGYLNKTAPLKTS